MAWYDGLKDAAVGGASGAATGATFGVPGAIVGGLLGAGAGWLGGQSAEKEKAQRQAMVDRYRQQAMSAYRDNQAKLISNLEARAAGQGPSLAQAKAQNQMGQVAQQAGSMAMSGRGNAGAAQQAAINSQAMANQQIAGQAVQTDMEERMRAQELLGMNITQGRQADFAAANSAMGYQMGMQNQPTEADAMMGGLFAAGNQFAANYTAQKAAKEKKAAYDAYLAGNKPQV